MSVDLNLFLDLVNNELKRSGFPVDIGDLPDQEFTNYFEAGCDLPEGMRGARALVMDMICNGDLPDWHDLGYFDIDA